MEFFQEAFVTVFNMSITASITAGAVIIARLLLKKAPKVFSYALCLSIITVIVLGVWLISNPIKGFSIYEHPETFLGENSLRTPAKVLITDNINGKKHVLTEVKEIAQVTEIIEDMRIARKEIGRNRSGTPISRYSISYYEDINDVKPSFRYELINQKDIEKRLDQIFAAKEGRNLYDTLYLFENKAPYIGDNSKVSALVNALPLADGVTRDGIKLSTSKAPYGLVVNYSIVDNSLEISEEQFLINSVLLLALIDNADVVTHIGYWNNKLLSSRPFEFTHTRENAERIVGGDVRKFAENEESIKSLLMLFR